MNFKMTALIRKLSKLNSTQKLNVARGHTSVMSSAVAGGNVGKYRTGEEKVSSVFKSIQIKSQLPLVQQIIAFT